MSNKQNHIVEVNKMVSSIDKEFVPYVESLSLKELGFDEPCFGFYNAFGFNINTNIKNSDDLISIEFERIKYNLCTTPTFSQVFRWFRENYNILSTIYSNASGYLYEWHDAVGGTHRGWSEYEGPNNSGVWDTYEEAELTCLRKLIEIVPHKVVKQKVKK